MNTCETCKFWTKPSNLSQSGQCFELRRSDKVEITITTGMYDSGGFVNEILVDKDFGCVLYEPIK